eukprot:CAMPEP_0172490190 /NCGR_PEP_ID=MMETSP1066-20121228/20511_1 /TAXON_ID=671091 /ORGANISM="Coscinodiscus wailesii, Strain CCMP2513" /LENGTH=127 /DNA_ID=CAMNT_0013258527 /DNA_START=373 /DNA_END=752 /DNA_ORIENTATION=-
MELWQLPNILIIHLKRFEYGGRGVSGSAAHYHFTSHLAAGLPRGKLETFVDFDLDEWDVGAFLKQSRNRRHHSSSSSHYQNDYQDDFVINDIEAVYDLFGVINHYGRMGFGHYTAMARSWDERGNMG